MTKFEQLYGRFPYMIRCIRKDKGLTQTELAEMLGIGVQSVWNLEHGNVQVRGPTAYHYAFILGCCPIEFVEACIQDEFQRKNIPLKVIVKDK